MDGYDFEKGLEDARREKRLKENRCKDSSCEFYSYILKEGCTLVSKLSCPKIIEDVFQSVFQSIIK